MSEQSAYERLRAAIFRGELAPGEVYSQAQLEELLDLGRTPLREAVRRVQSEDLLEAQENRRLRVAGLDPADLGELYAMRIMLESLGVRLTVAGLDAEGLDRIRASFEAHVRACEERDLETARQHHREFHFGLFGGCGPRLLGELRDLWDHAQRYRRLYLGGRADEIGLLHLARRDHEAILAAAEDADATLCAELSARHMAHVALTLFAHLDLREEPAEVRAALELAGFVLESPA